MITANELKIGNRFVRELHTSRGLEYDHSFILTADWMGKLFSDNLSIALQDLFPIPLTPEILEKAGFIEVYRSEFTATFDYNINTRIGYGWDIRNQKQYFRYVDQKFYHITIVHQLQNFYNILTGLELEFTP